MSGGGEVARIQKVLARAGIASRRAAEEMVTAGRVTINGTVAQIGQSVDPARDVILVDGRRVGAPPKKDVWFVLHKPTGYVTTRNDEQGRQTVFELVPETRGLNYVGRLDYMTEGVLLFTTDGDAIHRLTHPSSEVERTYEVTVLGDPRAGVSALRQGVELEDGFAQPRLVEAESIGKRRWLVVVTITEGRNREIRRLFSEVGLEIEQLVRTRFGPVLLGKLPLGEYRTLRTDEIGAIRRLLKPKR